MKLSRRQSLHLAAGAAALPAASRIARAQSYPTRPVRVIVPVAPGGGTDIVARLIGQWLSEQLGQPFIVDNRPGGGTNIGTEAVVRAPADGYTLLLVGTFNAINGTLYDKLNFNFIRNIAPVAGLMRAPYVMVVNPSVPAKTIREFIAYAQANPGKLSIASGGTGTGTHMTGELFKMLARIDMPHVPYRGGGPALNRAGLFRGNNGINRIHQNGQAASLGGNDPSTCRGATGHADHERFSRQFRRQRMVRRRCAQEYICRDH
jgi:tripartite-type tricarboxylate transporter receptor subunit TctC